MLTAMLARRIWGKSPAGGAITGPCDIAALEQLRDLSYAHLPDIKRVPTDIFIWSFGETDQRMVTKIGGLRKTHAMRNQQGHSMAHLRFP